MDIRLKTSAMGPKRPLPSAKNWPISSLWTMKWCWVVSNCATAPLTSQIQRTAARAQSICGQGQGDGHHARGKGPWAKSLSHQALQHACSIRKLGEALTLHDPTKQPTSMETREEIRALTDLPVMPEAHNKLLMLLSKPDREVDLSEVARTLEMDPGLSSRVMRVCKSAYFGFQGNMMKQALAFLGVEEIRRIVQSAVVYDVFREDEDKDVTRLKMRDLWKHSIGVGIAMELLGKSDKNKTHFLLGTLHDLGKAIFKFHFPIHFNAVMDMVENENMSMFEAEQELLGITHAECGGVLATHWDLPIEVRTAITSHHSPSQHPQHRQLSATVHICDIAIRTMKIGYAGDP